MSSESRFFSGRRNTLLFVLQLLGSLLLMAACDFQPKGLIVFRIEGKAEYDKATLTYPESAEARQPLKLRWADTNTWATTATLAPGRYLFQARSSDGMYYGREITVQPEVRRYELPATSEGAMTLSQGPELRGEVMVQSGPPPAKLVVLFIADDIVIRRVTAQNGKFVTNAPAPGSFRVEVHALGSPPRSFIRQDLKVAGPTDLGLVTLQ